MSDNKPLSFIDLNLKPPILQALKDKNYLTPSPIQEKVIPIILKGHDVLADAQTGTGKTAGFILPILQRLDGSKPAGKNEIRSLILSPTRELAAQIFEQTKLYGKHLSLKSAVVFGGVSINPQIKQMNKGVDILIATPGRLLDLAQQQVIKFNRVEIFVLDEADRMLDMGFIHDIRKVLSMLPKERQNLMFSATFSPQIQQLAKSIVNNAIEISTSPKNSTVSQITQTIHPVDKKRKTELLIHLIKENNWHQVLAFSRTKHGANKITKQLLNASIKADAIHGNKSQNARTKALDNFKQGKINVLIATDIAARGIDIDSLPHVINIDLPSVAEDYVHRIGRTGRKGNTGEAISLVSADEVKQLQSIETLIKKQISRTLISGFAPDHELPETKQNQKNTSFKPKKSYPSNQAKTQPNTSAKKNNRFSRNNKARNT